MYIERRQPRANTPEGWADTLRRDRLAPLKLRFDPRWRVIRKHLAGPILDAGCGRGDWVAFLARRGYEAIGLDYSEAMTSANRAAYPNCRFEAGRIQSMPFADKSFGGIVSWGVIEHDEAGPGAALAEFRRVLRPGPGFVMRQRMDRLGADVGRHLRHHRRRRSASQHQCTATCSKITAQCRQTVVQPPALRRTHAPMARSFVIEDEQRDDRPRPRRSGQCGMIGKAQVIAEPDEMGC